MKKSFLLILISLFYGVLQAQSLSLEDIKNKLDAGISVRNMKMEAIHSNDSPKDTSFFLPESKITCNYMRFYEFEMLDPKDKEKGYIGKVFMSERYEGKTFTKLFSDISKFKNNKNGYYMICKLFISENSYKINIYPNYELNVCNKKEHKLKNDSTHIFKLQDGKYCDDKIEDDKPKQMKKHYDKFKELVTIRDYEIEDFWNEDNSKTTALEKQINYQKMIKCFRISLIEGTKFVGFELEYTKNAKSNDKSYQTIYHYDYRDYDEILKLGAYNSFVGFYQNQNRINVSISQLESEDPAPLAFLQSNKMNQILDFGDDMKNVKKSEINSKQKKASNSVIELPAETSQNLIDSTSKKGWVYLGTYVKEESPKEIVANDSLNYKLSKGGFINKSKYIDIKVSDIPYPVGKSMYLYNTLPIKTNNNGYKRGDIINVVDDKSKIKIKSIKNLQESPSDLSKRIWAEVEVVPNSSITKT